MLTVHEWAERLTIPIVCAIIVISAIIRIRSNQKAAKQRLDAIERRMKKDIDQSGKDSAA